MVAIQGRHASLRSAFAPGYHISHLRCCVDQKFRTFEARLCQLEFRAGCCVNFKEQEVAQAKPVCIDDFIYHSANASLYY